MFKSSCCEDYTPGGAANPATPEPAVPCGSFCMRPLDWILNSPKDESVDAAIGSPSADADRAVAKADTDGAGAAVAGAGAGARLGTSCDVVGVADGASMGASAADMADSGAASAMDCAKAAIDGAGARREVDSAKGAGIGASLGDSDFGEGARVPWPEAGSKPPAPAAVSAAGAGAETGASSGATAAGNSADSECLGAGEEVAILARGGSGAGARLGAERPRPGTLVRAPPAGPKLSMRTRPTAGAPSGD